MTPKDIITSVARSNGLLVSDLTGQSRETHIVHARRRAVLAIKDGFPLMKSHAIGRLFGRHRTIVNEAILKKERPVVRQEDGVTWLEPFELSSRIESSAAPWSQMGWLCYGIASDGPGEFGVAVMLPMKVVVHLPGPRARRNHFL